MVMPKKTVKTRLEELETKRDCRDKPLIVIYQSLEDETLFYFQDTPQDLMTEGDALRKIGDDYDSIWVRYARTWRETND